MVLTIRRIEIMNETGDYIPVSNCYIAPSDLTDIIAYCVSQSINAQFKMTKKRIQSQKTSKSSEANIRSSFEFSSDPEENN